MSLAEKEQLLRRQERFASLDPQDQERLRRLNRELEQDPDAPRLREVMDRYYNWLKTLPPYQRLELTQLSPQQRVERIKKLLADQKRKPPKGREPPRMESIKRLLQEQAKKLGKQLEPRDIEGLFAWCAQMADRYGSRFLENLPESRRKELQQQLDSVKDPHRRRLIFGWLWMQWQSANPGKSPPMTEKDLAQLHAKLSATARERLKSQPPAAQWRTISEWITLLPQERPIWRSPDELISEESEKELAQFFEYVLTAEEKDRLLAMPGDQMVRELWREYARAKLSKSAPRPGDRAGAGKRAAGWQGQRAKAAKPQASSPGSAMPTRTSPKPPASQRSEAPAQPN